jgi:4-hydroxybenzoyl-CoA thioesterase
MVVFERHVKFEEVDAANIVFFARFVTYAHEAMEHFFGALDGGYAGLILERRVGLPAVHVEIAFTAPARYGDLLRIETRVARIGNRSAVLWYRMHHAKNDRLACELKHTVVTTDLRTLTSCEMPADVRALLLHHFESPA